jgi:hypothetical protein
MNTRAVVTFSAILVVVVVIIILLVTGGGGAVNADSDPDGDVAVSEGPNAPPDTAVADISSVEVSADQGAITFEAEMASDIPRRVKNGSLAWRWELYEEGQMTWLVTANVDLGPNASLVATQKDYSSSTIDDTLPGSIQVEGTTLRIRVRSNKVKGFPKTFDWLLKTSLDASRTKANSAVAEDVAPDSGYLQTRS